MTGGWPPRRLPVPPERMRSGRSMLRSRCLPGGVREWNVAISNRDISVALAAYLERYPEEAALLSEPGRLLSHEGDFASRRHFPVHVTAGALLVRGAEILLVEHRAYGIVLQPGVH